jgi:nucleoside-diphosphate-sugar epimerase
MSENTYLVTGSMGCIGAWALYHLVKQKQRVISFDISDNRSRVNLLLSAEDQKAITFIKGDLTNFDQVLGTIRDQGVTNILHLAALQVPFCRANPVLGAQVNVVGTVNIFEAARQAALKQVAYASSIAVFGPATMYPAKPLPNDALRVPSTLYGVYKVANEDTARVYWQDYKVSSVALRPYTVYGVGRDQGLTSDPTAAILAAVKGTPYQIKFSGTMQFQWASDMAQQFIDAGTLPTEGAAVYNLGGTPATVETFVSHLKALKPDADITWTADKLAFPLSLDDSLLRRQVPKVYETPLKEGIGHTFHHFQVAVSNGQL